MPKQKGPGEIFCRSCGEAIKKEAELCPECGVRNTDGGTSTRRGSSGVSDSADDVGPLVAWGGGILIILVGIGTLSEPSGQVLRAALASVLLIATGLFCLPAVRDELMSQLDVNLSQGLVVTIAIVGLFVGVAVGPS